MKKEIFAKGKRGIVYLVRWKGKKAIRKEKLASSKALSSIENEIYFLKILNRKNIGPRLYEHGKGYFIEEFIEGERIIDFLEKADKKKTKLVLKEILLQARTMDQLNIDKKEMTNPYKHIIINKKKIVQIDFERCRKTKNPKNVSQFVQFITSKKIKKILDQKYIKLDIESIRKLTKTYKRSHNEKDFKKLLNLF